MLVRAVWSRSRYGENKVFLRFIVSPQGLCLASDAPQYEVSASALLLGGIPERVQRRPNMRTKLIMLSLAAASQRSGLLLHERILSRRCDRRKHRQLQHARVLPRSSALLERSSH